VSVRMIAILEVGVLGRLSSPIDILTGRTGTHCNHVEFELSEMFVQSMTEKSQAYCTGTGGVLLK